MKRGALSEYFKGIGIKRLSAVEAEKNRSNQHEFNGVKEFKLLFGTQLVRIKADFLYLSDDEEDFCDSEGNLTWYDARENHPTRTEYRLYYTNTDVSKKSKENDLLIIAQKTDNEVLVIVAAAGSTIGNQLLWLFGYSGDEISCKFKVKEIQNTAGLGFISSIILAQVGIVLEETNDEKLKKLLNMFPNGFPTTTRFSEFARKQCKEIDLKNHPDEALMRWLDEEESLFRVYENHVVSERIGRGFRSVDDFVKFSLSVQNRRKSRAGYSLENHLRYLFSALGIKHDYNKITERQSKPDFVFPSINNYADPLFPVVQLTMLGVKTTCKDRWRQVLAEAERIKHKHLFTLEPGISENQTQQMIANKLQLVTPSAVHGSYKAEQQKWLLSLSDFNNLVLDRQKASF